MPASRTDSKSPRIRRREQGSPVVDGGSNFDDIMTPTTNNILTDEQLKLRAMIPAITVCIFTLIRRDDLLILVLLARPWTRVHFFCYPRSLVPRQS